MTISTSNKKEAVDFYLSHGFTLFQLHGKVPPKNCHWREMTYEPFFVPIYNFGVALSETDLVIDVDPRNGGEASFLRLPCELPPTLTVWTGNGGKHFYFKKPEGFLTRKNVTGFPGLDFITSGGYVVGAGSIHPTTNKEYILEPLPIADAPKELLELIEKQKVELIRGTDQYVTDAQTKQRFIDYLQTAKVAVLGESGDQTTFSVIAVGRDYGLPPETVLEIIEIHYNLRCEPPWSGQELQTKVNNVYKYAEGSIGSKAPSVAFPKEEFAVWPENLDKFFHKTKDDHIKMDQHNTALMFAPGFPLEGLLAMDLFSHNIIFKKAAPWHKKDAKIKFWSDEEATLCRHWLSTNKKYEPPQQLMHDAAVVAAYQYQFHPVKDYFESLEWDGHKRVHNWMVNFLGTADDIYTRAVGLKTLVACVKRIYEPGCKFDYITVLEGAQDTGKSTAWRILAGKQWFGDTPIDIAKEWSIMKTFGKLMYEWAEMETFRKSGTQAMKAFLSSDTDTVRLPYNRTVQAIPRQGIFVGTFNPESDTDIGWLHDTTGNRRYWVVKTCVAGDIRNDKLEAVRDQLWAEALVLYRAGTPIYFEDSKVITIAQEEQQMRLGKDSWQDAIETWINAPHNLDIVVFTGDEIYKNCLGGNLTTYRRPEMARIGNIMQQLGWHKGGHYHTEQKRKVNGYRRPMLEVN